MDFLCLDASEECVLPGCAGVEEPVTRTTAGVALQAYLLHPAPLTLLLLPHCKYQQFQAVILFTCSLII